MSRLSQLPILAIALVLPCLATVQAQEVLDAGREYSFGPGDTQCYLYTVGNASGLPVLEATCNNSAGRADLNIATNGSLRALDLFASVRFQKWITISDVPDAPAQSLVPVTIRLPSVSWNINLFNDVLLEFFGQASADIVLTVRKNPTALDPGPDNVAARGQVVAQKSILSTSHGGAGAGCFVNSAAAIASTNPIAVLTAAFNCGIVTPNKTRQSGAVDLVMLMEPGQTYNIELELRGSAVKKANLPQNANFVTVRSTPGGLLEDPPGVQWSAMLVSIGTDAQQLVAGLQEQIDDLADEIDEIRYLLETHTHEYLTGKGQGHNNTVAETSSLLQELPEPQPDPAVTAGDDGSSVAAVQNSNSGDAAGGDAGGGAVSVWLLGLACLVLLVRRRRGLGINFGLTLAAELAGDEVARTVVPPSMSASQRHNG